MKRKIEYSELVENGEVVIRLLESGDWSVTVPDKITHKDVIRIRALLSDLIDEQEILK